MSEWTNEWLLRPKTLLLPLHRVASDEISKQSCLSEFRSSRSVCLSPGHVSSPWWALGTELWTRQTTSEPSQSLFHGSKDRCQATHPRAISSIKGEELGDKEIHFFLGHLVSKPTFLLICIFLWQFRVPHPTPRGRRLWHLVRTQYMTRMELSSCGNPQGSAETMRPGCWSYPFQSSVFSFRRPHSGDSGLVRPPWASQEGERDSCNQRKELVKLKDLQSDSWIKTDVILVSLNQVCFVESQVPHL